MHMHAPYTLIWTRNNVAPKSARNHPPSREASHGRGGRRGRGEGEAGEGGREAGEGGKRKPKERRKEKKRGREMQ